MSMTRQEQLDDVVRNYGQWPSQPHSEVAVWCDMGSEVCFFTQSSADIIDKPAFTREEVEQRKAELQNKPSWDDAPKGVKYFAQCPDGDWYWFKRQPVPYPCGTFWEEWDGSYHAFAFCSGEVIGDWRDTIEERPEPEEEALKMTGATKEKAVMDLLEERGERYGDFEILAEAVSSMTAALYALPGTKDSTPAQREAAHMIIQKLCRAFNGDPHYADNWIDAGGYAKLGEMSCTGKSQP